MITYNPATLTPIQMLRLLQGTVMPRPVALVSTLNRQGYPALFPCSYYTIAGSDPGTLVFSPVRNRKDPSAKDTILNIKEIPEVVINAVTYRMVEQANLAGHEFTRATDAFLKAGFTALPSEKVRPFRIQESPVHFECAVKQVVETGKPGAADMLIICEVLLIHIDDSAIDSQGRTNPDKLDVVGRMGGDVYVKASGKALFRVRELHGKSCAGVDAFPEEVRMSSILTGNDLGRLGSCDHLPSAPEVLKVMKSEMFNRWVVRSQGSRETLISIVHSAARELIARNEIFEAAGILLASSRWTEKDEA